MSYPVDRIRKLLPTLVAGAGFLVLTLLILLLPVTSGRSAGWKGYYTFVIDAGVSDEVLTDGLHQAGLPASITAQSATVQFNDISRMGSVPVADIASRFDPLDPRIDPYMQRVGEYFQTRVDGTSMKIAYIPISSPGAFGAMSIDRRLHRAFDRLHVRWLLVEWNPGERLLFVAVFIVLTAAIVRRTRAHRFAVALSALPWTVWILLAGYGPFVSACILYFAWVFLLEEAVPAFLRRIRYGAAGAESAAAETGRHRSRVARELRIRVLFCGFALVVALMLQVDLHAVLQSVAPALMAIAATLAFASMLGLYLSRSVDSHEHPLFMPVRIMAPTLTGAARGSYTSLVPMLIALVLMPPIVMFLLPVGTNVYVPRPVPIAGGSVRDYAAEQRLWEQKDSASLPDLSDYLAHRAYQTAFLYHRDYGFPSLGEPVLLNQYDQTDGKLTKHAVEVMQFDAAWFDRQLTTNAEPAHMLIAQPSAVRVVLQPVARIYSDYSVVLRNSLIVFFVFSPFLLTLVQIGLQLRFGGHETLTRRRKQEA